MCRRSRVGALKRSMQPSLKAKNMQERKDAQKYKEKAKTKSNHECSHHAEMLSQSAIPVGRIAVKSTALAENIGRKGFRGPSVHSSPSPINFDHSQ